ncbi:MAG: helix-turn-helix domain-containing protein [Oscillospiraceae bacterium]|nr:helix-turn-helix domain-containing protein [Oscillospiraceae bacterium]
MYTLNSRLGPFTNLLSLAEAAEIWRIDQSTIRKAIEAGRLKPEYDCRKFGKQWVVTAGAMRREFPRGASYWDMYIADLRKQAGLD